MKVITPAAVFLFLARNACLAQDAVFNRHDRDRDGKVTPVELTDAKAFAYFDSDKDGVITLAEYSAISGKFGGKKDASEKPNPTGGPRGRIVAGIVERIAKAADKNEDGKITKNEAGSSPWFTQLDKDGNNEIDASELALGKSFIAQAGAGTAKPETKSNPQALQADIAKLSTGPEMLKPGDVGIGRMVPDIAFTDLDGKAHRLSDYKDRKGLVIAMTSATCPVSKRYLASLASLEKECAAHGVAMIFANPLASEKRGEIQAQIGTQAIRSPYVCDSNRSLVATLQAQTTTEVFLLDSTRTLIYRGALDDQYGVDYNLDAPRHRYLVDAVSALVKGKRPKVQATRAPGCDLEIPDLASDTSGEVSYNRDVARILLQNCVQCHREGGIAPFALDSPDEVLDRAKVIRRVVADGVMPPWFAAPQKDSPENPWANDCSLGQRDKADLLAWLDSKDRPMGNAADAPTVPVFPSEWTIGKPDLILSLSKAYDIKATGFMPYQFDVVQTELTEDKWVSGYEILPSERDVVHHVIVRVHEKGSQIRDREEGTAGYWAAYVPGNGSHVYPDGYARKLPAGARVTFQIHYTPSGTAKKERLRMGLIFAKTPPLFEMKTLAVANPRLSIPPGAAAHVETVSRRVPFNIPITGFVAHMHVRGSAFKYEVTYPDSKSETLLDIPRYDFNWQLRYDLKVPKMIPAGSAMKVTAVYDNSPANKANPDPSKTVRWGPQTTDEMMIGYLEYFVPVSGTKVTSID